MDRVRHAARLRHLSRYTEKAYVGWIRRFILFHGRRHPVDLGPVEITAFLSNLAVERNVTASTQNQALSALLFLYRAVLGTEVPWLDDLVRAKRPPRLPTVLSRDEAHVVLRALRGMPQLMAMLLYGCGLRLIECSRLRVKDVDFERRQIVVRAGEGNRDRVTMLPASMRDALRGHLVRVERLHRCDVERGAGWVELPNALAMKYPNAARSLGWQWVFPATRWYVERSTGQRRRHHFHETAVQRAVRDAARAAGLTKRVTCHTFDRIGRCGAAGINQMAGDHGRG